MYYMTQCPDKRDKLRAELGIPQKERSAKDWSTLLLNEETINNCSYLSYCVYEALRMEPSVRLSTRMVVTEACELGGKQILKD